MFPKVTFTKNIFVEEVRCLAQIHIALVLSKNKVTLHCILIGPANVGVATQHMNFKLVMFLLLQ